MKKPALTALLLVSLFLSAVAQSKPMRIVFDVTSGDSLTHKAAVRHANEEAKAHPDGQFEIVIYSGALDMVVAGKSTVTSTLKEMLSRPNASVKVCEATMKRYDVTKAQLLPGVQPIPDGIVEIIDRQGEGWGYIKEAR